ncbi:TlpA disulfide reductase family protein [Salegentibacter maritimus]|uniref:AhpC/TSA family protein n=1 Tax=Salegentibacter maritimus TaxID=2794347 RepID=A0ABS0TG18_9FLAO|nr:TlpA disulfide reductase family protein [Salegentibacter maritimus]MBI6119740.1 AhpC/TSA family protein [Salegentibacter maritimus]
MRKIIMTFAIAAALTSCQEDKGYTISGDAPKMEDGKTVYVSEIDENTSRPIRVDSTTIKDGSFKLDLQDPESPNLSFLEFEGTQGNVIFISENEEIKFKIYKDSLRSSEISGGKENKLLQEYLAHLKQVNEKVMQGRSEMQSAFQQKDSTKLTSLQENEKELIDNDKVFKKKMVQENPGSFVSIMVISDMLRMKSYPVNEIQDMFAKLSEEVQNTAIGKQISKNLKEANKVAIGSKAPNFTAPTPEGDEIALKDVMGKVTVIDFWAAWCKPCRVENPNLVKTYNKYKDDGLSIIGVSLDRPGQKDRWVKAIKDDGLPWHQVSNLQFWQDPVAQLYGIKAIPAAFVLNEEGTIVARDLRGEDLDKKIGELLNKN